MYYYDDFIKHLISISDYVMKSSLLQCMPIKKVMITIIESWKALFIVFISLLIQTINVLYSPGKLQRSANGSSLNYWGQKLDYNNIK